MTEPAPAEGDDESGPRPLAPIPFPPDPMAPWLLRPTPPSEHADGTDDSPSDTT